MEERPVVPRKVSADRDHESLPRLVGRREERLVDPVVRDGNAAGLEIGQLEQLVTL